MRALLALIFLFSTSAFAKPPKVILTVSLSTKSVLLVKNTKRGPMQARGEILPVVAESMHTNVFRPLNLRERFVSPNGNVPLKDVILFDNNRTLRKSLLFHRLKSEGLRTSGTIVMEPEFGSLVFSTIKKFGLENTVIVIRN